MNPELGQCGWINWIEDGGDGSACPNPATRAVRFVPPEGGLPIQAVFCDDHIEEGTARLHSRAA